MPSSACDWSSDVCSSDRSEEHTSELQSRSDLVCRLLLEKKKTQRRSNITIEQDHNANDRKPENTLYLFLSTILPRARTAVTRGYGHRILVTRLCIRLTHG